MRYRTIHTLVCFLLLMAANIQADNLTQPVPLVPCPVSIVPGTGNFHFSEKTTFAVENEEQAVEVRRFTALLTRAPTIPCRQPLRTDFRKMKAPASG